MSTNNAAFFQTLLEGLRNDFLSQLSERCDSMDISILRLEKEPANREVFDSLYRVIHSLKGSGGTHGLNIITSVCHQLEDVMCQADARQCFDSAFTECALKFVDLLREVDVLARETEPDYSSIVAALHEQRMLTLQHRKSVLIADPSRMMAGLYQHVLESLPLQTVTVDEGLVALERLLNDSFDLAIIGRELKTLNGIALIAALRASNSRNRDIPVVLITAGKDAISVQLNVNAVVLRNQRLSELLRESVTSLLNIN